MIPQCLLLRVASRSLRVQSRSLFTGSPLASYEITPHRKKHPKFESGPRSQWPKPDPSASYLNVARPDVVPLEITVPQLFEEAVEKFGDMEAVISAYQNITITYKRLKRDVDAFGVGLLKLGLKPGDRIGLWAPKCYEWMVAQMGVMCAGFVLVNIHPAHRIFELESCLKKSELACLIISENIRHNTLYPKIRKIIPDIAYSKSLAKILYLDKYPTLRRIITISSQDFKGCFQFSKVIEEGRADQGYLEEVRKNIKKDDLCNIAFTSGTTGEQKAVMMNHFGLVNTSYGTGERLCYKTGQKQLILTQPHHSKGSNLILAGYHFGVTSIFCSANFNPIDSVVALQKHKAEIVFGTPTMLMDLLAKIKHDDDVSYVRTVVSTSDWCNHDLMRSLINRFSEGECYDMYGVTEVAPVVSCHQFEDDDFVREHTVGYPMDFTEVKIVNIEGATVPCGTLGELWIKVTNGTMGKYWEGSTPDKWINFADKNGWFHTRDICEMREDGQLMTHGRMGDVIARGGEAIWPKEIENLLHSDPRVAEVHAYGVPDLRNGEELAVWIKIKRGHFIRARDITRLFKDKLATYKVPTYIMFGTNPTVTKKPHKLYDSHAQNSQK